MTEEKKETKTPENAKPEIKKTIVDKPVEKKWRQIILETDGNNIKIIKADVAGNLELLAILQSVIGHLSSKPGVN